MPALRRRERPGRPLRGYKLARPLVSADAARVGFSGVMVGRAVVYGALADAVCVQVPAHRCPARRCDCGFYCLHSVEDARALSAEAGYQETVLLEVAVSGRYIRYEKGLRYSRQTVRAVRVGRCGCGRGPGAALADAGGGAVGWRTLVAACADCARSRPVLTLSQFARSAGIDLEVTPDDAVAASGTRLGRWAGDGDGELPVLAAEIALVHARLDQMESRLDRLSKGGSA
ncbi:MAG: hypothetical protein ACRDT0_03965 [Pseudonocardiaceae bacterium]